MSALSTKPAVPEALNVAMVVPGEFLDMKEKPIRPGFFAVA
jgi:hypothetical protein